MRFGGKWKVWCKTSRSAFPSCHFLNGEQKCFLIVRTSQKNPNQTSVEPSDSHNSNNQIGPPNGKLPLWCPKIMLGQGRSVQWKGWRVMWQTSCHYIQSEHQDGVAAVEPANLFVLYITAHLWGTMISRVSVSILGLSNTNTRCICTYVHDHFVEFVFVLQWSVWRSPMFNKDMLRNVDIYTILLRAARLVFFLSIVFFSKVGLWQLLSYFVTTKEQSSWWKEGKREVEESQGNWNHFLQRLGRIWAATQLSVELSTSIWHRWFKWSPSKTPSL